MASTASDILQDLADTLRATGQFAQVTIGPGGSNTAVPRANVLYESTEDFQPDDQPDQRWARLRSRIAIRTRCQDPAAAVTRANDLCAPAAAALMTDPYRGGRCQVLPIGRATEVGRCDLMTTLRRPEVEMSFSIRNHFVTQEGQ